MSDYKRMVSYIYNYEKGMKRHNVGYARIETRNGQCKITVNIKALSMNQRQLKVYVYKRVNGKIMCLYLGDMLIKNGIGDFKIITEEGHMMNTPYAFSEMGGIIIYDSEEKYFGTEWDDRPIIFHRIEELMGNLEQETEDEPDLFVEAAETKGRVDQEEIEAKETESVIEKEVVKTVEQESTEQEQIQVDSPQQDAEINKEIEEEQQEDIKKPVKEVETKEVQKETKRTDVTMEKNPEASQSRKSSAIAEKILTNYPSMYPFADEEIIDCVRIEPQDIGMLPMETWILGNNSFLLHGYYGYRHLIFASLRRDGQMKYILGVPGINQNRERFMARMFGFEHFKGIKAEEQIQGEFGYWYLILNL